MNPSSGRKITINLKNRYRKLDEIIKPYPATISTIVNRKYKISKKFLKPEKNEKYDKPRVLPLKAFTPRIFFFSISLMKGLFTYMNKNVGEVD